MRRVLPEPLIKPRISTQLFAWATFIGRLLARISLAVYFGGFTFYAAVVVPDLHEHLGGMETGEISRRVALFLYPIGAAAFGFVGLGMLTDRESRSGWRGKTRLALLGLNSGFLVALILMHRSLGTHLDSSGEMNAFRSFHELYLTVWTGQWLAILGLLGLDLGANAPQPQSQSRSRDA